MTEDSLVMTIFFNYVSKFQPKFCECGCGERLPKNTNRCNFDHVLEKETYSECKYSKKNIRYYLAECHANKTNGFPTDKQQQYKIKALEQYNEIVKESSKFEKLIKNKIWEK